VTERPDFFDQFHSADKGNLCGGIGISRANSTATRLLSSDLARQERRELPALNHREVPLFRAHLYGASDSLRQQAPHRHKLLSILITG
jgi:hypothetical protein